MILVTIGTLPLWASNTWNDWTTYTWEDLINYTWRQIFNCHNVPSIKIAFNTLSISDRVEDQSVCDFTLYDFSKEYHFLRGQPVYIYNEDHEQIFGGFINSSTEQMIGTHDSYLLEHKISCIDNHYLVNKRKLIKAFKEELVTDCAEWIFDNILVAEGITLGEITASTSTITKVCNFLPVNSVLDELAETIGYTWFISADKKFYFIPINKYLSPYNIEFVDNQCSYVRKGTFSVVDGNPEFRNIQYIKGSKEKTDLQTEYISGNGIDQTFPVAYQMYEEPTILLNGNPQTVGIKGVDSTEDWFWSKNDNTITQLSTATKLTSSDILTVQYYGLYNMTVKSSDFTAIANNAILEGSSGIVEEVLEDSSITTKEDAISRANAMLTTFAVEGKTITWDSDYDGLEAGQLIHIIAAIHELNHNCLITEVEKKDEDGTLLYSITAISGPVSDFWVKYWSKAVALKASSDTSAGTSEVLQILMTFTKNWTSGELPNIWNEVFPGESTFASSIVYLGFDTDDRIKYLQLNVSGNYRRYRTSQVRTATQILTTVIVPSADANAAMTEASLWGGSGATITPNTGIKVTSHSLVYTKNDLESFLLVFTDNKWS